MGAAWDSAGSHVHELVAGDELLRVGGLGGCFGSSSFVERRSSTLQGFTKRHYTRDELKRPSARTRPPG